jgi:5-methylcytosine-specific restriction endonuclease McrA
MAQANQCRTKQPEYQAKERATRSELKALLVFQQYCCSLSGLPLTPETAELDHITSLRDGGNHTVENLQWLHRDVNRMKTTMKQSRFVAMCRLIASSQNEDAEEHF